MIRLPENKALRAGLFMVCAMGSFVCNDTIVKVVGPTLPTGELIMLRGVISLLILLYTCYPPLYEIYLSHWLRSCGIGFGNTVMQPLILFLYAWLSLCMLFAYSAKARLS